MSDLLYAASTRSVTDQNGARWLIMRFDSGVEHFTISPDYAPELGAVETSDDLADIATFISDFASKHPKLAAAGAFTDSRGTVWARATKTHIFKNDYYAATKQYRNGVAVYATTESGWKSEVDAAAIKHGPPPPPVKPPVVDPAVPPPVDDGMKPPPVSGIAKLTDEDYRAIGAAAKFVGAAPLDLLLVLYRESGLYTTTGAKNKDGYLIARGLNQLTFPLGAGAVGITDRATWESISNMTFAQQIALVQKFFEKTKRAPYSNATVLYQTNIGPATVGSNVVYKAGSSEYESNKQLDFANKGHISTDDLSTFLDRAAHEPAFATHLARMNALGFPGNPNIAGSGISAGIVLALGGIAGVLVYLARRDTSPARRAAPAAAAPPDGLSRGSSRGSRSWSSRLRTLSRRK